MVTGYFLLALMAYTKSTGDDRYTKKGSLKMQATENTLYQHDIHSCYEALITNWNKSELTLFPCEVCPLLFQGYTASKHSSSSLCADFLIFSPIGSTAYVMLLESQVQQPMTALSAQVAAPES
jgi:hypothetical protein